MESFKKDFNQRYEVFSKKIDKDYYIKNVLIGLWGVDFILSYAPIKKEKVSKKDIDKDPILARLLEGSFNIYPDFGHEKEKNNIRISFKDGFISLRKTNESYTTRFWGDVGMPSESNFIKVINSKYISWLKESKKELEGLDLKHFIFCDFDDFYEIISYKDPIINFIYSKE